MKEEQSVDTNNLCPAVFQEDYLDECEALVKFIGRNGDVLSDRYDGEFEKLAHVVTKCRQERTLLEHWPELVAAYSAVTKITMAERGVNGRSVQDTIAAREERLPLSGLWYRGVAKHQRPLRIALWLSAFALTFQYIEGIASTVSKPMSEMGWITYPFYLVQFVMPMLIPAIWGGLGACVFLMKQLNDRVSAYAYEEARFKGYGTRIFLGAIFGVVVIQWLFDTHGVDKGMADTLGQTVTAFAAGLGTKAVYAAFEALIEETTSRIKGIGTKRSNE